MNGDVGRGGDPSCGKPVAELGSSRIAGSRSAEAIRSERAAAGVEVSVPGQVDEAWAR
jgi:hypothetical protein